MTTNNSNVAETVRGSQRLARALTDVRERYCGGSNRELARRIGRSENIIRRLIRPLDDPDFDPNPTAKTLEDVWGYLRGLDEFRGLGQATVFEWAGQLAPRPQHDQQFDDLVGVWEELTPTDRYEVLEFARLKVRLRQEREEARSGG